MVNQDILYQMKHLRTTTTNPGFRRGGGGVVRCGGLYGRPRSPCSVGGHPIFTRPQQRATIKACTPSPGWPSLPIPTTLAPTGDDNHFLATSTWLRGAGGCRCINRNSPVRPVNVCKKS